jgi:hypothetical protein
MPLFLPVFLIPFNLLIQLLVIPALNVDMEIGILASMSVIAMSACVGIVGIFLNNKLRWYTLLAIGSLSIVSLAFSVAISGL